jgi:hypothetical protein
MSAARVPFADTAPAGAPLAPAAGFLAGAWANTEAGDEQMRTARIPRLKKWYLFDITMIFKERPKDKVLLEFTGYFMKENY